MTKTLRWMTLGLACAAAGVQAQTAPTAPAPTPMVQGLSSVEKNLERDPGNKGLQNAQQRLQDNQVRYDARRTAVDARVDAARMNRVERPTRPAR